MCVLRVCTSAPRKLWNQKAGANRNACVHFACVRFACVYLCAAKLVESAGRHVHFACVRFACVCSSALRKLWDQEAGEDRNACVHFACVRFACVYLNACVHVACVRFSQLPPDVGFQSLFLGHCAESCCWGE